MSRTRRIVFTKNNWTEEDFTTLMEESLFSYVIIGKETGETGTPHLQGYAEFHKAEYWSKIAKKHRMHVETAKTSKEAIAYCQKEGNFTERGTPKDGATAGGLSEKNRWEDARTAAKEGRLDDLPADIYFRYYRVAKEIAKDHMVTPESLTVLDNIWIYGQAGCGKTRLADAILPGAYSKNCNKWWDGYQNQSGVIVNDFGKDHSCLGHHLKLWSENRPFIAETKGGSLHIRPKRTIVTSQYSIKEIWEDQETKDAIERRFKVLHVLGDLSSEDLDRISKQFS